MDTRFITVSRFANGFAAVCYWLNKDESEPTWQTWQTDIGRYTTETAAEEIAMNWAFIEDIMYVPSKEIFTAN